MAKNNGKPSEELFENHWKAFGKRAFYYRITDAAEVRGRTGKIGYTRVAPSDYIVTFDGLTEYAEVKSTQSKTSFPFSLIKTGQNAAALQVITAGGGYFVYVHNLNTGLWYKIPYSVIRDTAAASIPWSLLENYQCQIL